MTIAQLGMALLQLAVMALKLFIEFNDENKKMRREIFNDGIQAFKNRDMQGVITAADRSNRLPNQTKK